MTLELRALSNFRSIKGVVSIPLDAPIVLLHGLNGAGKTSVLSALELALTGDVATLRRQDNDYVRHLVHQGAGTATLEVTGTEAGKPRTWITRIADAKVGTGDRVLDDVRAQFYAERCYLAQFILSRLLDIYSSSEKGADNALTKFVKDLLRLDELDALITGLEAAGHLRRAKSLAPLLGRADDLRKRFKSRRDAAAVEIAEHANDVDTQLRDLRQSVIGLGLEPAPPEKAYENLAALQERLGTGEEVAALVRLAQQRREIAALGETWNQLPQDATAVERAQLEAALGTAVEAAEAWRVDTGAKLAAAIDALRGIFPSLPSWTATDPATAYTDARRSVGAELSRLQAAIADAQTAARAADEAAAELARAHARLEVVDEQIAGLGDSTGSLARALAEIAPHVHGDDCPVCGRNYGELRQGSLQGHVQATIVALSEQAGRLAALATERSEAQTRASELSRRSASAAAARIGEDALLDLQQRLAGLAGPARDLAALEALVATGADLLRAEAEAQGRLAVLRDRDRKSTELRIALASIAALLGAPTGDAAESFEALAARTATRLEKEEARLSDLRQRRAEAISACEKLQETREKLHQARLRHELANHGFEVAQAAFRAAEDLRSDARDLADTARSVRTGIVIRVFNEALNKLWRDLFVRLAPTEPFVPAFVLPQTTQGVEAKLETRTRSGEKGGTPGAMLSAGNLNTAALTLFLALHLSVEAKVPWLVLDDPVQSMDEVHIAQFAALLRTLAKDHGRKVFIAVHERALFDYLRLELAPAFDGDQLVTVELRRSASEETFANVDYVVYEGADVVAAA